MKLTITEGYRPTTYEVTLSFDMDISDADSLNASTKTCTWNVCDPEGKHLASALSIDIAMLKAGQYLSDRAFMQRMKEEDEARAAKQVEIEVNQLQKNFSRLVKGQNK